MAEIAVHVASEKSHAAEILGRARALVSVLDDRAEHCETLRRLPDETARDFHEAGLFRILQPARVGGAELDYGLLVDVGAELARGCASSAWTLTNLASHHWMLGMFPPAAQDDVWGQSPDHLIGSSFVFPAGRAQRRQDGFVFSGYWPFSSGVDNCDWNMLAGVVGGETEDDPPEYRIFLVPESDYEIIDTWQATGLRGTGSKDVRCHDIFIPEHRTLPVKLMRGGPTPGSAVNPAPLFQVPVFCLFPYVLSGVALGNARGAWETYVEDTKTRTSRYSGVRVGDFQTVQVKIAEAGALIDSARMLMRGNCAEAMALTVAGRIPEMTDKVRYRRDGAFTVQQCTKAVDIMFAASGGGGIYNRNPVQRRFRDAHAINAHLAFNFDMAGTAYGRVALGQSPDNPTL